MAEREYNNIIVVDENNENPRAVTYPEAKANGWIRRASRVFVINASGKILIQQRSEHISRPLLLDCSAAGHVDEGESYAEAAIRELCEELGVRASEKDLLELPEIKESGFFSRNYLVKVTDDVQIIIDPFEVNEYFWLTVEEIDNLTQVEVEKCHVSLIQVWPQVRDKLFVI